VSFGLFNGRNERIGFMHSFTTSWISASSLVPVCHYWTHWL